MRDTNVGDRCSSRRNLTQDSCRLPATEFQRLPWSAWRRTHASMNGSECQIKVAESRIVLSNLCLAHSLTEQSRDMLQRNPCSFENGFSTKSFRIGDNPVEPLAVQVHILDKLLPQRMEMNRHRQLAFFHQKIGAAPLPPPCGIGGFTHELAERVFILFR